MDSPSITQLLNQVAAGDATALDQLTPLLHNELRALAARLMRDERLGHTLQPTALVHEAYLRLAADQEGGWANRVHFMRAAARAMRQVLVDHALARRAAKRGGGWTRVPLDGLLAVFEERSVDLIDLDQALERLASFDALQSSLIELRFFGGMSMEDAARLLGVALRTAEREWSLARAWLRRELGRKGDSGGNP